jgi:hypothetical protein
MSTHKYTYPTIQSYPKTKRALGASESSDLEALFPGTPGLNEDLGEFKKKALKLLLSGEEGGNQQTGPVDRDFGANASDESRVPPDLRKVETGAGGLPASPYLPNPVSPGEGSSDPKKKKAAPEGYGTVPTNSIANDGKSTSADSPTRNPFESSKRMSVGAEDAPYISGQSPATVNAS